MSNFRDGLSTRDMEAMLAVRRLCNNAYGVTIKRELKDATGREPSVGALYTVLERLEKRGFLESRIGEATAERGGRAKKFFKVTGAGATVLNETLANLDRLRKSEGPVFGGGLAGEGV